MTDQAEYHRAKRLIQDIVNSVNGEQDMQYVLVAFQQVREEAIAIENEACAKFLSGRDDFESANAIRARLVNK